MKRRQSGFRTTLKHFFANVDWVWLVIGIVIGLLIITLINYVTGDSSGFLQNLVPEAVGLVFTVLILDNLGKLREEKSMVEQLVRRMHSRYNHTALAAIEELRVIGHLQDGTIIGREMRGSSWKDANLYEADLSGCDLMNADVLHADFVKANLTGALITDEQLAATDNLCGARMPDGSLYDGRFTLMGDLEWARRKKINLDDPEAMADFYGVSVAAYMAGKTWWSANQDRFQRRSRHYDVNDPRNQPLPS